MYLDPGLQSQLLHRLHHHGTEVQQVIAGQHSQQLVEAAPELRPGEKEYGHNVPQDTKQRENDLENPFKQEAGHKEKVKLVLCQAGALGQGQVV